MKKIKYAVFILTYGRANNVLTVETLKKSGYTGKIYFVCSTDDKSLDDYKNKYGDDVIVFNKREYQDTFDIGDNFENWKVVVYARNAVWDIAKKLGYQYFIVMDDDYLRFNYISDDIGNYKQKRVLHIDSIFETYFSYLIESNSDALAMIQTGDLMGGKSNPMFSGGLLKRKIMNVFFFNTEKKFPFVGRINEDAVTYVYHGERGKLFLQLPEIILLQTPTQQGEGGLTDFYLETGTYYKSFYSIIFSPSCVKIGLLGDQHQRLHHKISWNNATPKIIGEKHKK